jgi:hypothetical protein
MQSGDFRQATFTAFTNRVSESRASPNNIDVLGS